VIPLVKRDRPNLVPQCRSAVPRSAIFRRVPRTGGPRGAQVRAAPREFPGRERDRREPVRRGDNYFKGATRRGSLLASRSLAREMQVGSIDAVRAASFLATRGEPAGVSRAIESIALPRSSRRGEATVAKAEFESNSQMVGRMNKQDCFGASFRGEGGRGSDLRSTLACRR